MTEWSDVDGNDERKHKFMENCKEKTGRVAAFLREAPAILTLAMRGKNCRATAETRVILIDY